MQTNNEQNQFLSEGTKRVKGREAQRINILIGKAVANAVKSTLGPKGMDKMIVDELGDVTISNDGATILKEMAIDHPIGKMLVNLAKNQDSEVGDGTTTAVVLAGSLLEEAEGLLDNGIHPSNIINGYRIAGDKAIEFYGNIAIKINPDKKEDLHNIALTSLTGKASESCEKLADLTVSAIMEISEKTDKKTIIDIDNIKIEKKEGSTLENSELVKGIVLDKERTSSNMPTQISNAKIALLDVALEIKGPETDTKVQINTPQQLQAFIDQEESMIKEKVDAIKKSGANVVFCQKGIDDLAQHFLAKLDIIAVRRVKKSDLEKLAKATGANIVSRLKDLRASDLGSAKLVEEKKVAGESMIFVRDCKNPKAVTILLRGGTEQVINEAERAVNDAVGSVASAIRSGKVVVGAGSCETEVAMLLREFAKEIGGREQLAIEGFANALEVIPKTLAETAGMNPLDAIVALRNRHKKEGPYVGVDVMNGRIADMKTEKVIEPLQLKIQAISSASEVTQMILRIDDVIAGSSKGRMPSPGMDGMGGMD